MPNLHSSAFNLFQTRIADATMQLEGLDACIDTTIQMLERYPNEKTRIGEVIGIGGYQAKALKIPINQRINFSNRLRKKNCEYTFHVLYTYFSEYLRGILREMYRHNPNLVIGKASGQLDYHEIVKLGTYDSIANHMVDQVFKRLEATKSSTQLLDRILDHTGVSISPDLYERAIMYIEVRHLIVHQMGKMDAAFIRRYSSYIKVPHKEGSQFAMNKGFARSALKAVYNLLEAIDLGLVSVGLASSETSGKTDEASTEGSSI